MTSSAVGQVTCYNRGGPAAVEAAGPQKDLQRRPM